MRVPLSHILVGIGFDELFESFYSQPHICFVGSRDDRVEARSLENGCQHTHKLDLRLIVEVATLLCSVGIPEARHRFVEGFERFEFDAILVLIVLAYIHQIVGKLFIVFRT